MLNCHSLTFQLPPEVGHQHPAQCSPTQRPLGVAVLAPSALTGQAHGLPDSWSELWAACCPLSDLEGGRPKATGGVPEPCWTGTQCPGVMSLSKRNVKSRYQNLEIEPAFVCVCSFSFCSSSSGFLVGCGTLNSLNSTHRPIAQGLQALQPHGSLFIECPRGRRFPSEPTSPQASS